MDGYQELANAIVLQAAMDYMNALEILRNCPDAVGAAKVAAQIEQFMHSGWFGVLTCTDPDRLLDRMRETVDRDGADRYRPSFE